MSTAPSIEHAAPRPRLHNVQALRALAAAMVVVGHSILETRNLHDDPGYLGIFNHAFGVAVFFVISGFIMAYTAEGDFGSSQGRKNFALSRLTRIVPIYWLMTSLLLVTTLAAPRLFNSPPPTANALIHSYLFIPLKNAVGVNFPILAPGWSLDYEMFFYFLFFLAMFAPAKLGLRLILGALVALVAYGTLFDPRNEVLAYWTDPMILKFATGIMIAQNRHRLARMKNSHAALLGALGVAMFIGMHFLPDTENRWRTAVDTVPATLIVLSAVALDLRGRSLAPVLLVALGDASYSLYLSHMFVVRGLRVAWNGIHLPAEPILFCCVALVISCVVGTVLARTLELPLHRWMRKGRRVRKSPEPAAALS